MKPLKITPCDAPAGEMLLARRFIEQIGLTEVVNGTWFSYNLNTGCWDDNEKDDYRGYALDILDPSKRKVANSRPLLDHVEDRLRCNSLFCSAIKRDGDRLDSVLINVLDCVLRVTPGAVERLSHLPDYRFTRCLPVAHDPDARFTLYEDTIPRILPDPLDQELHQLLAGNILVPDCRFEVSAVIYGEAGTGKDTLYAPIVALLDKPERGLITNHSLLLICDPKSYVLPQLQFALLNLCTELNSIHVGDSSIFKQLVSGSAVAARPIYKQPFDMRTPCKIASLSNNMPQFKQGTAAENRRLRYLHPELQPTSIDVTLKDRLRIVHAGTLNWMVEGLQKLLRLGPKPMPYGGASSQAVHECFNENNDPIGQFVAKHCIMALNAKTPKDDLQRAFFSFGEENDLSPVVVNTFLKRLYLRFTNVRRMRIGSDGFRLQVVSGIALTPSGVALKDAAPVTPNLTT